MANTAYLDCDIGKELVRFGQIRVPLTMYDPNNSKDLTVELEFVEERGVLRRRCAEPETQSGILDMRYVRSYARDFKTEQWVIGRDTVGKAVKSEGLVCAHSMSPNCRKPKPGSLAAA